MNGLENLNLRDWKDCGATVGAEEAGKRSLSGCGGRQGRLREFPWAHLGLSLHVMNCEEASSKESSLEKELTVLQARKISALTSQWEL